MVGQRSRINGYLEVVSRTGVRGWCWHPDDPGRHLEVEVAIGEAPVGRVIASTWRQDLQDSSIGAGDHGFAYEFPSPIGEGDLDSVRAIVIDADRPSLPLPRLESDSTRLPPAGPLEAGSQPDLSQRPLLLMGPSGAGMGVLSSALRATGLFHGEREGHTFDLLAYWSEALRRFWVNKRDSRVLESGTSLARVPLPYLQHLLDEVFIDLARGLHGDGRWIDATPGTNFINLAPRFLGLWPHAKFIFVKRRAIESIIAQQRTPPVRSFNSCSHEWAQAMKSWLSVRHQLSGRAVEIDEQAMLNDPSLLTGVLQRFLEIPDDTATAVLGDFADGRGEAILLGPEATNTELWSADEQSHFAVECLPLMAAYGYTVDSSCHRDGLVDGAVLWV